MADLDELWERVDGAAELSGDERRTAIETIDQELSTRPTADELYLRAYALYLHPDRVPSESVAQRFRNAISAVLALVPDHALVRLQLPDVRARMTAFAERSRSHDVADLHPVNLLAALRDSPELGALQAELAELDSALRLSWFSSLQER